MQATRTESIRQAFVLTDDDLRALVADLRRVVAEPRLSSTSVDRISREFLNLEEFEAFGNPESKRITTLYVRAHQPASGTTAVVEFESGRHARVWLSLDGAEEAVKTLSEVLDGHLSAIRPWYALLARTDYTWLLFAALGVGLSAVMGAAALAGGFPSNVAFGPAQLGPLARGALIGLMPSLLGFALNRVRDGVFPMADFAVGHGLRRHQRRDAIRNLVVVGFVVSFVSSIIASLVLSA